MPYGHAFGGLMSFVIPLRGTTHDTSASPPMEAIRMKSRPI